jgi:hypothetical protein
MAAFRGKSREIGHTKIALAAKVPNLYEMFIVCFGFG